MKLAPKYMFSWVRNSFWMVKTLYIQYLIHKSRWLPRWPPLYTECHNFFTIRDRIMKFASKYMFPWVRNSFWMVKTLYIHYLIHKSRWLPRWLPRWPPLYTKCHNFFTIRDKIMKFVSKYMFSCLRNSFWVVKTRHIQYQTHKSRWRPKMATMLADFHDRFSLISLQRDYSFMYKINRQIIVCLKIVF